MDFIRADFYRLMRSKAFWISQFLLFCTLVSTILFHLSSSFSLAVTISNTETAPQKFTGLEAALQFVGKSDEFIFFTLIGVSLILGVDVSKKLYKNCLSYGISKLRYYLSKLLVCVSFATLQLLFVLGITFTTASLTNGVGRFSTHILVTLVLTLLIRFLYTITWISIAFLVICASHSITSVFIVYFIGNFLLTLPLLIYPQNEWLLYLSLRFDTSTVTENARLIKASFTSLFLTTIFLTSGLIIFKKKNL